MHMDPVTLAKRILYFLSAGGFDTGIKTKDYWYEICKALVWDDGSGDHSQLINRDLPDQHPSTAISVDSTVFTKNLNILDTDVQKTLETIDQLVLGIDDHEVKATSTDTTHGPLFNELEGSGGTTIDVDSSNAKPLVRITSPKISDLIPTTDGGVGDPGNSGEVSDAKHQHPEKIITPEQAATELFYAELDNPNYGGELTCVVNLNSAVSSDVGWSIVPSQPGVYERSIIGALTLDDLDGITPVIDNTGCNLVGLNFMGYELPPQSPPLTYDTPRFGPYTIEDIGMHMEHHIGEGGVIYYTRVETHARIRRMPGYITGSAFVKGLTFYIATGNVYGNKYITFNSDPPVYLEDGGTEQSWTVSDSAPPGIDPVYDLCTRSQLIALGAKNTYDVTGTVTNGNLPLKTFTTIIGTPGVSAIPAGPWLFDFESVLLDSYPPNGSVFLKAQIFRWWGTGGSLLFEASSSPIYSIMPNPISFTFLGASYAISTTDQLIATVELSSTCTDSVTIHAKIGGPNWGSKITVPFQMPITGIATGAHDQLSHRSFVLQHPNSSLYSAIDALDVSGGWLVPSLKTNGDYSDYIRLTAASNDFYGISKKWSDGTSIPDGFTMGVYIINAAPNNLINVHSGSNPPGYSNYLPLANDVDPSGTGKMHGFKYPTELVYRLDLTENRWRLVSYQSYPIAT
jgi:hypothetical protein